MWGSKVLIKEIISGLFSGRRGSSIPVFSFPKIDEASFIFSISSLFFSSEVSSATKDRWNLTSSMYFSRAVSFSLLTKLSGR